MSYSEISLINQILEVTSEGPTVDSEMAYTFIEGAVLLESRSLGFYRSGRLGRLTQGCSLMALNTWLMGILNGVWSGSGASFLFDSCVSGWFMDSGVVAV